MQRLVLASSVLLFALAARAEDVEPPLISHVPITQALKSASTTITAQMEDESPIFAPTLYYRFIGARGYSSLAMSREGDAFVARVNATTDFEYWIEAYDEFGNGPSRDGTPERPFRVEAVLELAKAPDLEEHDIDDDRKNRPDLCDPVLGCGPVQQEPGEPLYTQPWFLGATGVVTASIIGALVIGLTPEPVYRNSFGASAAAPGR